MTITLYDCFGNAAKDYAWSANTWKVSSIPSLTPELRALTDLLPESGYNH